MPYLVKMASIKWACEICSSLYDTYQEASEHEQSCDTYKLLLPPTIQNPPNAQVKTALTSSKNHKPPKKKSKTSKGSTPRVMSGPESVPLNCSLTKGEAKKFHRLYYLLIDNLEFHQQINDDGSVYMNLRCSNCCAHSMRLKRMKELGGLVQDFKNHLSTCSSTLISIRDDLEPFARGRYAPKTVQPLEEYCTYLCELYGLVDSTVGIKGHGEPTVKFGECRNILIPGYKPHSVRYEAASDLKPQALLHVPPPTLPMHNPPTENPSIPPSTKLVLSDLDHFVVNQFQFICDRIQKSNLKGYDGNAVEETVQHFCKVQVCCKHCKGRLEEISSISQLITAKSFSSHLYECHTYPDPETLKQKILELALLKEKQMKEIVSIVPLREYILKMAREIYMISESNHGGMVIRSNPFPPVIAHLASSIPFVFPIMDDKWVQCASQIHPSPTTSSPAETPANT